MSFIEWEAPTNPLEAAREAACQCIQQAHQVREIVIECPKLWEDDCVQLVMELSRRVRTSKSLLRRVGSQLHGGGVKRAGSFTALSYHELAVQFSDAVLYPINLSGGHRLRRYHHNQECRDRLIRLRPKIAERLSQISIADEDGDAPPKTSEGTPEDAWAEDLQLMVRDECARALNDKLVGERTPPPGSSGDDNDQSVKRWAKDNLKGIQRTVVELIADSPDAGCPLADIAIHVGWTSPYDDNWNRTRGEVNKKAKKARPPFRLFREKNKGHIKLIGQK